MGMGRDVGWVRYGFILLFIEYANGFLDNAKVVQVGVGRKSMMCVQPKEKLILFESFLPNPTMMKRIGRGLFRNMEDGFDGE